MYFLQRYRYAWLFLVMLVFCSIMVIRQYHLNEDRRVELREAFILLHSRGYTNEAQRLFSRLIDNVTRLSDRQLVDDFQRTMNLVDPSIPNENNLIWKYHWTLSNEMEKRSEASLRRALKLANELGK
ncbi:hypothetical protein NXS98_05755 [Fontisphaera persica]|uniref:hypothetical protein n=1 Tax=Fontisphaera persica TaxID=2974023 RepID=UPI0024BF3DDF|nr:hypothetical protein [Fontisphaera persica]WCJ60634.1 hypothetical protein NXS98_05755 [Fontisphaera persica]